MPNSPRLEVTNPPLQPYRFGLFSAATIIDMPDGPWLSGVTYPTNGCRTAQVLGDPCPSGGGMTPPTTASRDFADVAGLLAQPSDLEVRQGNEWSTSGLTSPVNVYLDGTLLGDLATTPTLDKTGLDDGAHTVEIWQGVKGTGTLLCSKAATTPLAADFTDTCAVDVDVPAQPIPYGDEHAKNIRPGQTWLEGEPFTVYSEASCLSVGYPSAERDARERLALGEQWVVERWFEDHLLAIASANDQSGGTALPLVQAVSTLESALASVGQILGTIHMPRWAAAYMTHNEQLHRDSNVLRTILDNAVVFGAGYVGKDPTGAPPPPGPTFYSYATGPVVIRRGPVFTNETFDPVTNERLAIAERTYVITADCALLAANTTLAGQDPA